MLAILIFSIIAIIVLGVTYSVAKEAESIYAKPVKRWLIVCIVSTIISANGLVFMPTTKEALTIIGVGGTIEYIQENEIKKELPDKCVKALEMWVDSLIEEEQ